MDWSALGYAQRLKACDIYDSKTLLLSHLRREPQDGLSYATQSCGWHTENTGVQFCNDLSSASLLVSHQNPSVDSKRSQQRTKTIDLQGPVTSRHLVQLSMFQYVQLYII